MVGEGLARWGGEVDAAVFEQVYGVFQDFHACFAPLFGRGETRDHSRHCLQALLVQSGERRNARNLSVSRQTHCSMI